MPTLNVGRVLRKKNGSWLTLIDPPGICAVDELADSITELGLDDFSSCGLGQVGEDKTCRALEVREPLEAVVAQLAIGDTLSRADGDERDRNLAPMLVGLCDNRALHYVVMLDHDLLDLNGADVLATGDDQVLLAVTELDLAIEVDHTQVTGVKPAIPEGLAGCRVVVEIAGHHDVAAHAHFPQGLTVSGH